MALRQILAANDNEIAGQTLNNSGSIIAQAGALNLEFTGSITNQTTGQLLAGNDLSIDYSSQIINADNITSLTDVTIAGGDFNNQNNINASRILKVDANGFVNSG